MVFVCNNSGHLTVSLNGVLNLTTGVDTLCYNHTLRSVFKNRPGIAVCNFSSYLSRLWPRQSIQSWSIFLNQAHQIRQSRSHSIRDQNPMEIHFMDEDQFPFPRIRHGQHRSRILPSRHWIFERMCLRKGHSCLAPLQIQLQGLHQCLDLHPRIRNLIYQNPRQQFALRNPNHQQGNQLNRDCCYYLCYNHHPSPRCLSQLHRIRQWIPKRPSRNLSFRYLHPICRSCLQPHFQLVR